MNGAGTGAYRSKVGQEEGALEGMGWGTDKSVKESGHELSENTYTILAGLK